MKCKMEDLTTERLLLRKLEVSDSKEMYQNWSSSEKVTRFLTWSPHRSENDAIDSLKKREFLYKENQIFDWGIVLKNTDLLIGTITITNYFEAINTVEVGYVIGEKWWGKGIVVEALLRVIDFLFTSTNVQRIEATHDIDNVQSARVLKKAGFVREGIFRQRKINNRGIVDIVMYSLIKTSFSKERDNIFYSEDYINSFNFDSNVTAVFDDMVERSVPFYHEVQNLVCEFLKLCYQNRHLKILDIGSSTGTLLKKLEYFFPNAKLTGIDNSKSMVEKAQNKNKSAEIIEGDALYTDLGNQDIIILSLILQFIRPIDREQLLSKIYNSLTRGGKLILFEKIKFENPEIDRKIIDLYYNFKERSGYSKIEIHRKREALENVLIPYTKNENIYMLEKVGFSKVTELFRYLNFSLIIAER
ncbi:carboxy-S-adenosyl-L-methionine synthase CmoA [Streptococcus thermophilus]|nr:carboxy-S-adenosyl-L-methionine synthase CmoA [Streptococcus thermophilus]MCE2300243.1 carboxy-S-adenosyl-L-methionine synthase CmoA [Streptococcus thermophilus]MCE2302583.1 carboxy-S-adenosyl-L-methionine synthase CmoA [Streptococcus thermophilus]MCE2306962.1 carboxy-S-adenosyl-L-methionine synthase CmoA [Streptococcus thermophilus]